MIVLIAGLLVVSASVATADIKASYLYSLSDFYGLVPYSVTRVVSNSSVIQNR